MSRFTGILSLPAAALALIAAVAATPVATPAPAAARAPLMGQPPNPLPGCAYGTDVPGLRDFLPTAVSRASAAYAAGLGTASGAQRASARRTFAAAAAAYVYGLPQVTERATVKHFARNEIISVAALATPAVQTVVAPNNDTAYTVAWLDLTTGPMVIDVPDTAGRFYTFQFLDAFTNAFKYLGTGSTGTRAGSYVLVPPGWRGTLAPGLTRVDSPSNTVWLLGRTLVRSTADLPAVKSLMQRYHATPLAAWSGGERQPSVVLDSYPPTIPKSVPTGAAFIAALNGELTVDPPSAADDCALRAMAPAGVAVPHPTPAEQLLADLTDIPPPLPAIAGDPTVRAAIEAGAAAGAKIITTGEDVFNANSRRANNGWQILGPWVGRYGLGYIARAIVAVDLLGANTPEQSIYPIANTDVDGRRLDGSQRYTIRFARNQLPPTRAFWSLTMYNASFYLYENQIKRYSIGDRTSALHRARDGSLTIYVQHDAPADPARRANWLPAPPGAFHLMLRLYQPKAAALKGTWKPAPVRRVGAKVAPHLSGLRISPASFHPARRGHVRATHGPSRVSYRDNLKEPVTFELIGTRRHRRRPLARFTGFDRAGVNHFFLTGRLGGHALAPGRYRLRAISGSRHGPKSAPVSARFTIR